MKYSNNKYFGDDEISRLDSYNFKKRIVINLDGHNRGWGNFELKRNEIEGFIKKFPDVKKFACGHLIYAYENGKMKFSGFTPITANQRFESVVKCVEQIDYYKEKHKNLTDDIAPNRKTKLLGFERLRYCNNKMRFTMPFALYMPKNKKKEKLPLVIMLHGRGNGGESNIQPFTEFLTAILRLKRRIKKNPCIIAVPSVPKMTGYVIPADTDDKFSIEGVFDGFFNRIISDYPIDTDRVYIIGCSNGAGGIWSQLRLHPERYAASLPLMGWSDVITEEYFEGMKNNAIWVCHAENDNAVGIGKFGEYYGSDILVEGLKRAGNKKVKYSRYKKHGHGASRVFLLKEDWHSWVFEQKK